MAYKTVLTVVGAEEGDRDLKMAAELCVASEAHLSVLALSIANLPPMGEYGVSISDIWVKERHADIAELEKRVAAVKSSMSDDTLSRDIASEYAENAWAAEVVGRRARYADITVIGPEMLKSDDLRSHILDGAIFESTRPLLVVPQNVTPTLLPKRVVIAWDAGAEATRAVTAALPMLSETDEVHLALVDPKEGERGHGDEPGADMATYLARHGAKVTVSLMPKTDMSVADVLRQKATDVNADMIVMGAYGHSRMRERIFGGVTESMLSNPPLPLLLAH